MENESKAIALYSHDRISDSAIPGSELEREAIMFNNFEDTDKHDRMILYFNANFHKN